MIAINRKTAVGLAIAMAACAAAPAEAQIPASGYTVGPHGTYWTPAGPVTSYRTGPWTHYRTPVGPALGYSYGPWAAYQSPEGLVIRSYSHGPWTTYWTPQGVTTSYRVAGQTLYDPRPIAAPDWETIESKQGDVVTSRIV